MTSKEGYCGWKMKKDHLEVGDVASTTITIKQTKVSIQEEKQIKEFEVRHESEQHLLYLDR
jgi:hypothetical protein